MKKSSSLLLSLVPLAAAAQQAERPNIVYIMTDDHTAQMMSCYDQRYVETPNLDRIALSTATWPTRSQAPAVPA